MAKKRKGELPSGNIRIRVYDYTDENGKKIYKSFTAKSKLAARALANEWKEAKRELKENKTVVAAVRDYINIKHDILSPATIRGYNTQLKHITAHPIGRMELASISNIDVQSFVSDLSRTRLASKTIANTYGLLAAALKMYMPKFYLNITLPAREKPNTYTPSAADVQILLDSCYTTELRLAILFAAVCTMRRGEACAVTFEDIDYDQCTVNINKAYVKTEDNLWELKSPKTYSSYRIIRMPQYVINAIKSLDRQEGPVLNMKPDQLYGQFHRALERSGLPSFRYHDLRHYAASQMHASGVPDRYIEAIGGWKPGSSVLKRTYENILDVDFIRYQNRFLENNKFCVQQKV